MDYKSQIKLKAIIFDFDNTLVDTKGADVRAYEKVHEYLAANVTDCDPTQVIENFKNSLLVAELDPEGILPIDEWRTNLWINSLSKSTERKDLGQTLYKLWKSERLKGIVLSKEVIALLQSLRKSYKIVLMTNGDALVQREKLNQCAGWGYFDEVIISGDQQIAKPDPRIFLHAFESLNLMPEECVMVGDSLSTDIQGAINANLRSTIWISDNSVARESAIPAPDYKLKSVLNLPSVLKNLDQTI